MGTDEPKIGDVVIYHAYGTPGGEFPVGEKRAAIVTAVNGVDDVSLCVLNPTGLFFNLHCKCGYGNAIGGHWNHKD